MQPVNKICQNNISIFSTWIISLCFGISHVIYHTFSTSLWHRVMNNYRSTSFGNKANLRDLIAATGLVILLKFDPNRFFSPCDLEIWCMTSKNNRAPLLYYIKLCVSFQIHRWIQTEVTLRKRMTIKNNKAPLLCNFKLCASFHSHWWIQIGVRVRKRPIWVKCYAF